jgi:hypothetical protein
MTLWDTSVRNLGAAVAIAALSAVAPVTAFAGAQAEEHLASSVVAGLQQAIADNPVPSNAADKLNYAHGSTMSRRLV